jgi:hypothetical protein
MCKYSVLSSERTMSVYSVVYGNIAVCWGNCTKPMNVEKLVAVLMEKVSKMIRERKKGCNC